MDLPFVKQSICVTGSPWSSSKETTEESMECSVVDLLRMAGQLRSSSEHVRFALFEFAVFAFFWVLVHGPKLSLWQGWLLFGWLWDTGNPSGWAFKMQIPQTLVYSKVFCFDKLAIQWPSTQSYRHARAFTTQGFILRVYFNPSSHTQQPWFAKTILCGNSGIANPAREKTCIVDATDEWPVGGKQIQLIQFRFPELFWSCEHQSFSNNFLQTYQRFHPQGAHPVTSWCQYTSYKTTKFKIDSQIWHLIHGPFAYVCPWLGCTNQGRTKWPRISNQNRALRTLGWAVAVLKWRYHHSCWRRFRRGT